jgi:hypothetical protein
VDDVSKKKDALPYGWQAGVNKFIVDQFQAKPYRFTGLDPISRATLPSVEAHRRKKLKASIAATERKSIQILNSADAAEAAAALWKAERKAGNDIPPGTWHRTLALGIQLVARFSMDQQSKRNWSISAKEARETAAALRCVRRNAGELLIQNPDQIEDAIKDFESSRYSATGQRGSRKTHAIKNLALWHQQTLHDPVHVATAALIRASFGGGMTNDSVRSIAYRCLKKPKPNK